MTTIADIIAAGRQWIADCTDHIDVDDLDITNAEVRSLIARHYSGGWEGFRIEHLDPTAHHSEHAITSTDYAERAARYWDQSERAYRDGDPAHGDELADLAAQCEAWAHEDLTGLRAG